MSTAMPERLLIDGESNLLTAYVLFFEAYGYEIRTAADGVDAFAEYRAWRPEVVLLDIQMPRLHGLAVARKIRKLAARPVPLLVAVSALSAPSACVDSIQSGVDRHSLNLAQLPVILGGVASWQRARHASPF
jgi:CheY-like chemotaxis protein